MPICRHNIEISSLFCSRTFNSSHKSGGKRALHATDGLFHIVFNGWRNPNDRNLVQFALHADQFFFISWKTGAMLLRLQSKIFGVKKPVLSVPSSGRPTDLCMRNLGRNKYIRACSQPDCLHLASAGRKRPRTQSAPYPGGQESNQ